MAKDDKGVMSFNENDEYLRRIQNSKTDVPVGGVPMPPIPRFDQPLPDRHQPVQGTSAPQQVSPAGIMSRQAVDQLAESGRFIPGIGSAYAFNQPAMQQSQAPADAGAPPQPTPPGQFANPPRPAGAGLRPETVQGLEKLAEAQDKPAADKSGKSQSEKEADDAVKGLPLDDAFDLDQFGQTVRTILVNKERREAIEKRCTTINVEDLITHGELRQTVSIIPGKIMPTFRTAMGVEDLFIKRRAFGLKDEGATYVMDFFSLMNLCLGLHALNGRPLPDHLKEGEPDEALFQIRFKAMLRLPNPLLADLSANYTWFDRRVKKLLVIDEIQNF